MNFEAERPSGELERVEGAEGSTNRAARRRRPEELGISRADVLAAREAIGGRLHHSSRHAR